ncbi:MAG: hypothetical protein U1D55_10015 [Phycisphaerae bacterium]
MINPRIIELADEIRAAYSGSRALADEYNGVLNEEAKELKQICRAKSRAPVPELEHAETIFDRHDMLRRAYADRRVRRVRGLLHGLCGVGLAVAMWCAMPLGALLFPTLIAITLFGGAGVFAGELLLVREPLRRVLREHLIARGVPICIRCGYDLRGQVGARCPECGERLTLLVAKLRGEVRHVR